MALIAIVFAALGTVIGSSLKDMQGFQLVMNFMVMPIFFLSGALYPLSKSTQSAGGADATRSADVWCRWRSHSLDRCDALWIGC